MKLITFEHGRQILHGVMVDEAAVPLTGLLHAGQYTSPYPQSLRDFLAAGKNALQAVQNGLQQVGPSVFGFALDEVKLKAPITNPRKFLCIGMNYRDHCEEQDYPIPDTPTLFNKFSTSIIGPGEAIIKPRNTEKLDFEVELAFVIGKTCKAVREEEAMDYVAGYTIVNDISARDWQFADKQWVRGKSGDTFGPVGPCLVTKDEITDPHNLNVELRLNGQVMQSSNTKNLVFNIPFLIAYFSRNMTLEAGDLISTGTPGGVGVFREPPVFLKHGDELEAEIEKIGILKNTVTDESRQDRQSDSMPAD